MKQRLEEFIKVEAERGCEHCTHSFRDTHKKCLKLEQCFDENKDCDSCEHDPYKIKISCQLLECWKVNDEHFRRICTKLFAIDNAKEFFEEHN